MKAEMKAFTLHLQILLLHLSIILSTSAEFHHRLIEGLPPLLFQGTLLNDLQSPIPNAYVQFWQTDPDGVYNHPNAAGSNSLYPTFQYCGTATTADDGTFSFLTHRPGAYANRPTHFHYKVWLDGKEMLTSQFYFADENTRYSDLQVIELSGHEFGNGLFGYVTNKTIVLNMNLGGNGPFTPSDMEGPFYPLFDFFEYGNDLINVTFVTKVFDSDMQTMTPSVQPVVTGTPTQSSAVSNGPLNSLAPSVLFSADKTITPHINATDTPTAGDDKETMSTPAEKEQSSSRRLGAKDIFLLSLILGATVAWLISV